jgi:hypothetical protein
MRPIDGDDDATGLRSACIGRTHEKARTAAGSGSEVSSPSAGRISLPLPRASRQAVQPGTRPEA